MCVGGGVRGGRSMYGGEGKGSVCWWGEGEGHAVCRVRGQWVCGVRREGVNVWGVVLVDQSVFA